jgi:hypothetical protein
LQFSRPLRNWHRRKLPQRLKVETPFISDAAKACLVKKM